MIDWNAIATPREGSRDVHNGYQSLILVRTKTAHDHFAAVMDKRDREYFGAQPAEPNARGKQSDLFGWVS